MKKGILFLPAHIENNEETEFSELALAAGIEPILSCYYNDQLIYTKTFLGKGKIQEVRSSLDMNPEIEVLVFDSFLTPLQARELENAFNKPVFDYTDVILEIFLHRASTKQAKLQVESALLKRQLNRLGGYYGKMDRQKGNSLSRGSGEKQIALDKRRIQKSLNQNKKELEKIKEQKVQQRKRRESSPLPIVALAGYTNVGKSTLMNGFLKKTDAKDTKVVYEKDEVFATLDTALRRIDLPYNQSFILLDTVGFISKMPKDLEEAFFTTLQELEYADLILLVNDYSNADYPKKLQACMEILEKLDISSIPMMNVYNFCDLTEMEYPQSIQDKVFISAKDEKSISFLMDKILSFLFGEWAEEEIFIPYAKHSLFSDLKRLGEIIQETPQENGTVIGIKFRNKYRDTFLKIKNLAAQ